MKRQIKKKHLLSVFELINKIINIFLLITIHFLKEKYFLFVGIRFSLYRVLT